MCYKIASNFVQPYKRKGKNVRRKKEKKAKSNGLGGARIERLIYFLKGVSHCDLAIYI
jgi:hypothetical protein